MAIHYDSRMGPFRMRDDGSMDDEVYEDDGGSYESNYIGMSEGEPKKDKKEKKDKKQKKSFKGNENYRYDSNIPKNRRKTKVNKKDPGLQLTYPDLKRATMTKAEDPNPDDDFPYYGVCKNIPVDKKRGQKKCIAKIRAQYKKEHAILYTSECSNIRNPFKRKKCIAKYNRGF